MIAHVLRITGATAFIVLCTILPYLPGRYDSVAVPLSMMAQLVGIMSLLLVPVGVLLWAAAYRSALERKRYALSVVALIAVCVVWTLVSLAGMTESLALGLVVFGLGAYGAVRLVARVNRREGATPRRGSPAAVCLSIVPITVVLSQFALAGPLTEFSRSRAIRNSAPLIADIEAYRAANGRYPASVVSVHPDYKPSIIGIKEYRYEPAGDAYNVLFEQPSFRIGTREIVMYNPRDQQAIASHALDVLQLTAAQLALDRARGHNAVHDARQAHWKYFWFD